MTRLERKDKIQNQQRTDEVGNQIKVTALRGKESLHRKVCATF